VRRAVERVGDAPKDVETYLAFARSNAASGLPDDACGPP
jgi:hypothetical protein